MLDADVALLPTPPLSPSPPRSPSHGGGVDGRSSPSSSAHPLLHPYGAPPSHACLVVFPTWAEELLRPFDDKLINLCQAPLLVSSSRHRAAVQSYKLVAQFMTAITAIELGVCLPFILYVLGLDAQAELACVTILITVFLSQCFKRFLWRPRPWMAGRAQRIVMNKTSAFPSRAVTCAVVYGFLIGSAIHDASPASSSPYSASITCAVVLALLASHARVVLGAHYPSDCIVGALLGLVICIIGDELYRSELSSCSSCSTNECYSPVSRAVSLEHLSRLDWTVPVIGLVLSTLLALVSLLPPLSFWAKGAHVYATLLPCLVFHFSFLCPDWNGNVSLARPPVNAPVEAYFIAFAGALIFTGAGFAALKARIRGLPSMGLFFLLYGSVFAVLLGWRG